MRIPSLAATALLSLSATTSTASIVELEAPTTPISRKTQETIPISFYGLNYNTRKGPDWAADRERCKSRAEVVRDLQLLSRITSRIRLLSLVDCDQGALVWSILNDELSGADMEVWLGLWVGPDPQVFIDEYNALATIIPGITSSENWESHLSGISVGSEAIYREDVTISEAIANLDSTRALLQAYGMQDVPVAIVDIAPIYSNSQELRLASDTIMTNTFPFWEGLPIELAVDELDIDLGWLLGLQESQGKSFVLSEHGWPSGGYLDDVGIASPENQLRYLEDSYCFLKEKGWAYYWFTAIDNDWRQEQDPDNTIEGNWGFLNANLGLKDHFQGFEFSCPDDGSGTIYSFGAVDWSVPELQSEEPISPDMASCGMWQGCQALAGDCCPTPAGDFLGCCRSENFLGEDSTGQSPTEPTTTTPTKSPTISPISAATTSPTPSPTAAPTIDPTGSPTSSPTTSPTLSPTISPTNNPAPTEPNCNFCNREGEYYNNNPTIKFYEANGSISCLGLRDLVRSGISADFCENERLAIEDACCMPIPAPTTRPPTHTPTPWPTSNPTNPPTFPPTITPSSFQPTTTAPTLSPTNPPTKIPTEFPTKVSTLSPTKSPSANPTNPPTTTSTSSPTTTPTKMPSPIVPPTLPPTESLTVSPTVSPTKTPTADPRTSAPSKSPIDESTTSTDSSGIFPPENDGSEKEESEIFPWDETGGALPTDASTNKNASGSRRSKSHFGCLQW
eukprot:CAMPEP_0116147492 /NCGR_PEP_ID=MMETSP0329-20121206/17782_1 /TAXON_ID=697910 /ORGANISM="Pseudo-nitzschia arenysensis, Strain B593" /LENGTH=733 /DNA_ID=CAMNT_0003643421 /DNA_START=138 /DNA_END=2336 /DNA_ORIENTATION=-